MTPNWHSCSGHNLSVGVDSGNHINSPTGYSFDSDGNMTADGSYSYTFDAENKIITVSGTYCYTYDGDGLRVAKAHVATGYTCADTGAHAPIVDMLYWRNIAGNTIAETDSSGSTSNASYNEYIFFAGRRIARSNPNTSAVHYYFVDHLGSTRVMTQANGTVCFKSEYYPYGQELSYTASCNTTYKFTGYERDAETGNDYAFARYYNPRLGRFMSGDPLGSSADTSDPQSLNRYAYARNNPINNIDPTGQSCQMMCGFGSYTDNMMDAETCMDMGGTDPGGNYGRDSYDMSSTTLDTAALNQYNQMVDTTRWVQAEQVTTNIAGAPVGNTPGHWETIGSDTISPFGQAVLSQVRQQTSYLNDPSFYAEWYGLSAAVGTAIVQGPVAVVQGVRTFGNAVQITLLEASQRAAVWADTRMVWAGGAAGVLNYLNGVIAPNNFFQTAQQALGAWSRKIEQKLGGPF